MAGSTEAAEPSEVGDVLALVRAALEQGNVVVSVDGEVQDLQDTGLRGGAFEPLDIPRGE